MMQVWVTDMAGKSRLLTQQFYEAGPTMAKSYQPIGRQLDRLRRKEGIFLSLRLLNTKQQIVSDNFYWLPDSSGRYSGLQKMDKAALTVEAKTGEPSSATVRTPISHPGTYRARQISVTLFNPPGGPVAFFNRVSLVDPTTKQRLLPVFYSDNYLSVLPGESKTITLEYTPQPGAGAPQVSVRGWNVTEGFYNIKP